MLQELPLGFWGWSLLLFGNLLVFRSLKPSLPPSDAPLVSVLIPARNEARNIERCLASLLTQDYPNYEVLVLDDNSDDGTGTLARGVMDRERRPARAVVIDGTPLPDGWTGKNWACHQLSRCARGEFLLFTDADTFHQRGTLSATVEFARRNRAGLVSAWPVFITETWGEKLIIPVIVFVGLLFCAHWIIALLQRFPTLAKRLGNHFTRALGAANGQFMFFSRACYEGVGGHAAVRASLVDDIALGREVTARMGEGMRLCICDAFRFSEVRMYRSFGETWNGFAKNLRAVFGRQWLVYCLFILGLWACLLAPTIKWIWVSPVRQPSALLLAAMVMGIRILVTLRCRTSWMGALLHPVGVALVMAITLWSGWLSRGRGVEWKGRQYKPGI